MSAGQGAGARLNIHATLVSVGGLGVLLRGPARSGKSALALSLLRGAAREGRPAGLVADDRVELTIEGGQAVGSAPAALKGLIEISGVGIVRLPEAAPCAVRLVVDLEEGSSRLPEEATTILFGYAVRRLALPPRQAAFGADVILTVLGASALVPDGENADRSPRLILDDPVE